VGAPIDDDFKEPGPSVVSVLRKFLDDPKSLGIIMDQLSDLGRQTRNPAERRASRCSYITNGNHSLSNRFGTEQMAFPWLAAL
jgi:hypothetical protein